MAKVVNKEEKRRQIAISCKDLFLKKGIKVTVSELAKAANIGKGTIYEYFRNKEDIVFEILNVLVEDFNKTLFEKLSLARNSFDKLLIFSEFFYSEEDELKKIYKEFLAITLTSSNSSLKEYATKIEGFYYSVLDDILKEGVKNKELREEALNYRGVIYKFFEGFFLESEVTYLIKNRKEEFERDLQLIYKILRRNNEM